MYQLHINPSQLPLSIHYLLEFSHCFYSCAEWWPKVPLRSFAVCYYYICTTSSSNFTPWYEIWVIFLNSWSLLTIPSMGPLPQHSAQRPGSAKQLVNGMVRVLLLFWLFWGLLFFQCGFSWLGFCGWFFSYSLAIQHITGLKSIAILL